MIALSLLATVAAVAQNGDKEGEVQKLLVPEHLIPPAPVLSPEEALKSFTIKPGFRVEIVAGDDLLNTPVAMEFDADGRIWVVEMIGYMRTPDGTGEKDPVGRIVVLEDEDGDGRMDKRTVFLDGLVMPRAISLVEGGVIVAEMPNLWLCRDTDGDLKCDEKEAIFTNYVQGDINNPEHNANALMRGLDNWIYSANYTKRIRKVDGEWVEEPTVFRGQWGMSQDDFGRLTYDTNSDQLRMDFIPAEYLMRNPNYNARAGVNVDPVRNQATYPIRVTPGINRGYQPQMLKDGRLARFTGACGPVIYRGDNFPPEFLGNAFVCEPTGNLIKRNILAEKDGVITGEQAYEDSEFLVSTDERFRPVNLFNGPDGALYVVDMYRGLIQHRVYLTSYLRNQTESRGLETPVDLGRIYRIVSDEKPLVRAPKMEAASSTELVKQLSSLNGWTRDTAQRLLAGRADVSVVPELQRLAGSSESSAIRGQALWTLSGMNRADIGVIRAALIDKDPKVQVAALRIADATPAIAKLIEPDVIRLAGESGSEVQWQVALSLGNYGSPQALSALANIAVANADNGYIRDAVMSGVSGRELLLIALVLKHPDVSGRSDELLKALASAVFKEADPETVVQFFAVAAGESKASSARTLALLTGAAANMPKAKKDEPASKIRSIQLGVEPSGFVALKDSPDAALAKAASDLEPLISWEGKAAVAGAEVRALTEIEQTRFEQGKELYMISCGACHQPHGNGQEGLAPPLAGSEWVAGSEERIIRIVLHGLMGPMTVKDTKWDLIMPGLGIFEDEQLAGILTYVRREWGNTADPVTPEAVKAIRDLDPDRIDLWNEEDLLKIK